MPLQFCPRCRKRIVTPPHGGDSIHECKHPSDAIQKDSIPIMGNWEDSDGTSGVASNINFQGMKNELFGTNAAIDGEKHQERNAHGDRKSTHRLRQHREYILGEN